MYRDRGTGGLPVVLSSADPPFLHLLLPHKKKPRQARNISVSLRHLPSLAFSSTVLATMFSSSIKSGSEKEEVGGPLGLQGDHTSRCAAEWGAVWLAGWRGVGGRGSFTLPRSMSGLHFYQSRGGWYTMPHVGLQWELGKVLVVGDAFLAQFLTPVHSMRQFQQIIIKQM